MSDGERRPLLRVVAGDPTPEELAALLVVLAGAAAGTAPPTADPPSGWADRRSALRRQLPLGSGSWARSGREPGVRTRAGW